jgi:TetR/AcrR family transcriptional regulator, tetracycline repressor protein
MSAAESTPSRRGRPKLLELDDVVDAALAVLDVDGLDAVSFRRIGGELGVSHMTLYTYFDSKDELLNAMVARTLRVPAFDVHGSGPWEARLREAILEIHTALVARPGIAQLLVTQQFDGAWVGEIRDALLALLEPAGLGPQGTVDGISVLFNFLLGTVMVETSRGLGGSPSSFELGLGILIDGLSHTAPARTR